jgi:hypothetical protein
MSLATTPIIDWPADAKRIALELGRSADFLEKMRTCGPDKRGWLAIQVEAIQMKPEELSRVLWRAEKTVTLGPAQKLTPVDDEPAFTFRRV